MSGSRASAGKAPEPPRRLCPAVEDGIEFGDLALEHVKASRRQARTEFDQQRAQVDLDREAMVRRGAYHHRYCQHTSKTCRREPV